jgi:hypothetical protein
MSKLKNMTPAQVEALLLASQEGSRGLYDENLPTESKVELEVYVATGAA